ncbi:MAG TPA: hypothetical protein VKT53_03900 [Candidatus Acidoferrum sp.]|nr:hypothetical protein [Candidatus Acidoferrum sp.]
MRAVHDYGKSQPAAASTHAEASSFASSPDDPYSTDDGYKAHISVLFLQHDFSQLEKEIHLARSSKVRLQGGIWKLNMFYDGVTEASSGASSGTLDWDGHFDNIKKWIAAYPQSSAARIALAESYINYAWAARGHGYADTVSASGWGSFEDRISLAESTLVDAARLPEKCPYWYEVMQQVALAQGWDRPQARALFDEATAFEPTYYHYYREYANFLQTKWYGEEGETQAFAEEVAKRVANPEGSILYFEIASMLVCPCDEEHNQMDTMSWPKIKEGYATLKNSYGTSSLKSSRFAYMSVVAGDKESARATFAQLGEQPDLKVWIAPRYFQKAKDWATAP